MKLQGKVGLLLLAKMESQGPDLPLPRPPLKELFQKGEIHEATLFSHSERGEQRESRPRYRGRGGAAGGAQPVSELKGQSWVLSGAQHLRFAGQRGHRGHPVFC